MRCFTTALSIVLVAVMSLAAAAAQNPDYRITTDKPFYLVGEPVTFQFENRGTDHWQVLIELNDAQGMPHAYDEEFMHSPIAPGKTETWTWDQKGRFERVLLSPGVYQFDVRGMFCDKELNERGDWEDQTVPVIIVTGIGPETLVRTTKARYRKAEEEVQFYLLNKHLLAEIPTGTRSWAIHHKNPGTADYRNFYEPRTSAPVRVPPNFGRQLWNWDQKGGDRNQARAGRYAVDVRYVEGNDLHVIRRYFRIVP